MSTFVENSEGWTLTQGDRHVDQLRFDNVFGLVLDDGTRVMIEGPFIVDLDGVETAVTRERIVDFGPALDVLHRIVTQTVALRTGTLVISFKDGGRIEVPPVEQWENWQVILADGSEFIGIPGGGVTVFLPDSATSTDGRSSRWTGGSQK